MVISIMESGRMIRRKGTVGFDCKCLGVFTYFNEDRYEGQWTDNKKGPVGKYFYNDGNKYEGNLAREMKNGKGLLSLNRNRSVYI